MIVGPHNFLGMGEAHSTTPEHIHATFSLKINEANGTVAIQVNNEMQGLISVARVRRTPRGMVCDVSEATNNTKLFSSWENTKLYIDVENADSAFLEWVQKRELYVPPDA